MEFFEQFSNSSEKLMYIKILGNHFRTLALDSISRGEDESAKFQILREIDLFFSFAKIRDTIETGHVRSREDMLDEFISYALTEGSSYFPIRKNVCRIMGWCEDDDKREQLSIKRFVESCGNVSWE